MVDRFKDYHACNYRDLGYHAPTPEDQELIAAFCKLRKSEILGLSIGGFITFLILIAAFNTLRESLSAALIAIVMALLIGALTWWLFGFHPIKAVGTLRGRIANPHQTSLPSSVRSTEDGKYTCCVFDSTKQKIEDAVLPQITFPKDKYVKITRTTDAELDTEILVVKIAVNKYQVIYPDYYQYQSRLKTNGTQTNQHETDYSHHYPY